MAVSMASFSLDTPTASSSSSASTSTSTTIMMSQTSFHGNLRKRQQQQRLCEEGTGQCCRQEECRQQDCCQDRLRQPSSSSSPLPSSSPSSSARPRKKPKDPVFMTQLYMEMSFLLMFGSLMFVYHFQPQQTFASYFQKSFKGKYDDSLKRVVLRGFYPKQVSPQHDLPRVAPSLPWSICTPENKATRQAMRFVLRTQRNISNYYYYRNLHHHEGMEQLVTWNVTELNEEEENMCPNGFLKTTLLDALKHHEKEEETRNDDYSLYQMALSLCWVLHHDHDGWLLPFGVEWFEPWPSMTNIVFQRHFDDDDGNNKVPSQPLMHGGIVIVPKHKKRNQKDMLKPLLAWIQDENNLYDLDNYQQDLEGILHKLMMENMNNNDAKNQTNDWMIGRVVCQEEREEDRHQPDLLLMEGAEMRLVGRQCMGDGCCHYYLPIGNKFDETITLERRANYLRESHQQQQ